MGRLRPSKGLSQVPPGALNKEGGLISSGGLATHNSLTELSRVRGCWGHGLVSSRAELGPMRGLPESRSEQPELPKEEGSPALGLSSHWPLRELVYEPLVVFAPRPPNLPHLCLSLYQELAFPSISRECPSFPFFHSWAPPSHREISVILPILQRGKWRLKGLNFLPQVCSAIVS